jgi:hypothetical protein
MLAAANFWYTTLAPHVTATGHNTFLWGWLHGILVMPNFIYSLFNNHVTIYQSPNNGFGYNIGFLIGAGIFFGGSGRSVRRSSAPS